MDVNYINPEYIEKCFIAKLKKPYKPSYASFKQFVEEHRKYQNSYPYKYEYPCPHCSGSGFHYDSFHDNHYPCESCNKDCIGSCDPRDRNYGVGETSLLFYKKYYKEQMQKYKKETDEYNENVKNIKSAIQKLTDEECISLFIALTSK